MRRGCPGWSESALGTHSLCWFCHEAAHIERKQRWYGYRNLMHSVYLGNNYIQNVHLGRYIVGYMVGNFVLRRHASGAIKCNFRPYNWQYTSPNEHFEYGYPHSNALHQPTTSDVTYDIGAPTVYRRIYWRKFLTLPNQTSRYIRKSIRLVLNVDSESSLTRAFRPSFFIFLIYEICRP